MSVPLWAGGFSLHDAIDVLPADVIQAKLDLFDHSHEINVLDRSGRTPLQCAISRCFEPVVKLLISKGAKLDTKDVRGDSAMHYAVQGDSLKSLRILEVLVSEGVDVNVKGQMKQTPLHLAVRRDFKLCVEYLLKNGAKSNVQDQAGRTPLHYAVLLRKENIVKALLEHESQTDLKDENGQTALHLAAKTSFLAGVKLLVNNGFNINAKDNVGNSPLHYVLLPGKKNPLDNSSFINIFVTNNANLCPKNEEGQTPLHFAVTGNYVHEIELLFKIGADVNVRDIVGRTPLHYANMRKDVKIKLLKTILDNGADVNTEDDSDRTPLHWAAIGSFVSRGALLVQNGADVDAKDNSLNTPLHLCISKNSTEFVKLLLENGCKVDPKNINGYTPLQIAVEKDLKSISKLLMNKGAQVNIKDQFGWSPLHVAVLNMNVKIVEKLLQSGADVDCTDSNGQTALHFAAKYTFTESSLPCCKAIINLLLLNGSNVIMKDGKGQTPIELALLKSYNGFDIVQLLVEWGGLNTDSSLSMIDDTLKGLSLTSSWTFMKIVKEFIIKLKHARMSSQAPYNIDIKVSEAKDVLSHYCEELERMKNIKFGCHALSDIFFKYNHLTFLSNSSIKKIIFSSSLDLESEYPNYATILRATYLKARQRLELLPYVNINLKTPLPEEIMWEICSYFSDKDLKNVIRAAEAVAED